MTMSGLNFAPRAGHLLPMQIIKAGGMRALFFLTVLLFPFALHARSLPVADPKMIEALKGLTPDLPDWTCIAPAPTPELTPYLPMATTECSNENTSISLAAMFDPDYGRTTCAELQLKIRRKAEGEDIGARTLFQSDRWISERTGNTFRACSANQIVVQGKLTRPRPAAADDQASFELFHQTLVAADPAPVLDFAAESKAQLDEAFSIISVETHELDQLLPRPEGWEVSESLLSRMESLEAAQHFSMPALLRLSGFPQAGHTISRGDCRIQIVLSASPETFRDAGVTFAKPRMRDGVTGSFWRNRHAGRLHGQEALDGSRYQMVVDSAVVLKISGSENCAQEEGVATSLYEALLDEDYSRFRRE